MRSRSITVHLLLFSVFSLALVRTAFCEQWQQIKGEHFIVQYAEGVGPKFAKNVLRHAEVYYDKIASKMGYARYDNYWTWDNRTKIIIYFDKDSFIKEAHQPAWAIGVTIHDKRFFDTRTIITYQQDKGIMNGILPHEIGHLILRDFIGKDKHIPVWFEEGVAQLYEANKKVEADNAMRFLVSQGRYIPLNGLMTVSLNKKDTKENIAIFYSQSLSLVDFLISRYGNNKFLQLCKALRDGLGLKEAFDKVYSSNFDSLNDLERKWIDYLNGR